MANPSCSVLNILTFTLKIKFLCGHVTGRLICNAILHDSLQYHAIASVTASTIHLKLLHVNAVFFIEDNLKSFVRMVKGTRKHGEPAH